MKTLAHTNIHGKAKWQMIDQSTVDLLALLGVSPARPTARTNGGEYHVPCPFCGGRDRFVAMPNQNPPRGWCRQCGWKGDSIQLVRDMYNLSFAEALRRLELEPVPKHARSAIYSDTATSGIPSVKESRPPRPRKDSAPQSPEWTARMLAFTEFAEAELWKSNPSANAVRSYLHGRGISESVIADSRIGFNPSQVKEQLGDTQVSYWPGIVIPQFTDLTQSGVSAITVRTSSQNPSYRYMAIKGSRRGMYRMESLYRGCAALVTESALDALCVLSALDADPLGLGGGIPIVPLATGGAMTARDAAPHLYRSTSHVLLAFDADDAGRKCAEWWYGQLGQAKSRILSLPQPTETVNDLGDLYSAGYDIAGWLRHELGVSNDAALARYAVRELGAVI